MPHGPPNQKTPEVVLSEDAVTVLKGITRAEGQDRVFLYEGRPVSNAYGKTAWRKVSLRIENGMRAVSAHCDTPLFRLGRSGLDPRVEHRNAGLFEVTGVT
jgi:hypothetical protein